MGKQFKRVPLTTRQALNRNAENVIVIKDNEDVAKKFKQQFYKLWKK